VGWWLVGLALAGEAASPEAIEAGALYQVAMDSVFAGDIDHACDVFGRVVTDYPGTEEAARAGDHMARIARCRGEPAEKSGATELVVSQAIIAPPLVTLLVPVSLGMYRDGLTPIGVYALGVGGSIGTTHAIAKRWNPTQGQAMAVYTGELVGLAHGMTAALGTDGGTIVQTGVGGAILGGAAGAMIAVRLEPSAGDLALVRSGATWGVYGAIVSMVAVPVGRGDDQARRLLVGGDAGLLVGLGVAALGPEMSRRRVNHVNLAGGMGVLGASLVYTAAARSSNVDSTEAMAAVYGAGAAVGLGVGLYATSPAAGALASSGGGGEALEVLPLAPWRAPDGSLGVQGGVGGRF
jgi:hypothetical protein